MQPMSPSEALSQDSERVSFTLFRRIQYGLGSGSDYFAFDQLVGSSNFDAAYEFDPKAQGNPDYYPLYHTSYETFSMMKNFVDPDFAVRGSTFRTVVAFDSHEDGSFRLTEQWLNWWAC
jgi:hypothetical protein